ncbi:putative hemoglobin and hemoglobin-haptoglobin-binding protein 4precursor [Trichinella spiralis]|uniref:putative hemoglobin and hemoglobin-haptoglobin-binding protein 4precursor n=1 Tax=Trichinella spiralis TaxID=6334 RepID=UPI0001EFC478|nr:putative hemoglobin and hemoglobin-haptoglobin-binding protein 4precursor [Trichinella spiralis]
MTTVLKYPYRKIVEKKKKKKKEEALLEPTNNGENDNDEGRCKSVDLHSDNDPIVNLLLPTGDVSRQKCNRLLQSNKIKLYASNTNERTNEHAAHPTNQPTNQPLHDNCSLASKQASKRLCGKKRDKVDGCVATAAAAAAADGHRENDASSQIS